MPINRRDRFSVSQGLDIRALLADKASDLNAVFTDNRTIVELVEKIWIYPLGDAFSVLICKELAVNTHRLENLTGSVQVFGIYYLFLDR